MFLKIELSFFACLFATIILAAGRRCTKVNGVSGACGLKLNQFTLAGTHNSASGAFGQLWHWSGVSVNKCFYNNQYKSITDQLRLGIRYFDFDTSYIYSWEAKGWFWESGIVLVHGNGYTRALKHALKEINYFLAKNLDEIVIIRFKDHHSNRRAKIKQHLNRELAVITSTGFNRNRNPKLGDAIAYNQRIVAFAHSGFGYGFRYHKLAQIESYEFGGATNYCHSVNNIYYSLMKDKRIRNSYVQAQVDWFQAYGLCISELAGLCDGNEFYKLITINKKLVAATGRPVNLVTVDYAGIGHVRLRSVVRTMNDFNVYRFK